MSNVLLEFIIACKEPEDFPLCKWYEEHFWNSPIDVTTLESIPFQVIYNQCTSKSIAMYLREYKLPTLLDIMSAIENKNVLGDSTSNNYMFNIALIQL